MMNNYIKGAKDVKNAKVAETAPQAADEDNNGLFAPGAAAYVRRAFPIWLGRHWWLLIVPCALAVAAAWWPVCIFVALMVALLLYPSIIMMVYLSYATSRRAVLWTYPRRVTMDDNGLWIRYDAGAEGFGRIPEDCRILWSDVRRVAFSGLSAVAYLSSGPYDIIPLGWPLDREKAERLKERLAALGIEFA